MSDINRVIFTYKEEVANWWDKLSDETKDIIKSRTNFDADVFEDITWIKVGEREAQNGLV